MFSCPAAAIRQNGVGDHHHNYRCGGRRALRNSARPAGAAVMGTFPFVGAFQEALVPDERESVTGWSRHAESRAIFRSVCILHSILKVKTKIVEADVKYANWRRRDRCWHQSRHCCWDSARETGRCRRWNGRRGHRGDSSWV